MAMSKWLCLIFAVTVAGAVHASDDRLATKVDQSFHCLPLGELVPKLGELAGVKMVAGKEVADEMVFLAVRDRPLSEVMNHLAESLDMTWFEDGDKDKPRYTLKPSALQKKELARKILIAKMVHLNRAKKKVKKLWDALQVPQKKREEEAAIWREQVKNGTPPADSPARLYDQLTHVDIQMIVKLLHGWTDEDWVRLATVEKVACSTHPVADMHPLGSEVTADAKRWQAETKAAMSSGEMTFTRVIGGIRQGDSNPKQYDPDNVAELRITLSYKPGEFLFCLTEVIGRDGATILCSDLSPFDIYSPDKSEGKACSDAPLFQSKYQPPNGILKTGDYEQFGDAFLEEVFRRGPNEFLEPLDFRVGALLDDIAAKNSVSAVVPLCDYCAAPRPIAAEGKVAEALIQGLATPMRLVRFDAADGWLIGHRWIHEDSVGHWYAVPRSTLRVFHEAVARRTVPSLDDVARAVTPLTQSQSECLGWLIMACFPAMHVLGMDQAETRSFLRFWLTLSASQKQHFLAGDPVRVSELPSNQLIAIQELVSTDDDLHPRRRAGDLPPASEFPNATAKCDYVAPNGFLVSMLDSEMDMQDADRYAQPASAKTLYSMVKEENPLYQFFEGDGWNVSFSVRHPRGTWGSAYLFCCFARNRKPVDLSSPGDKLKKLLEEGKKAAGGP